jgi:hypothetical protein
VAVEVDIANVALLRIGQLATIADLDEETPQAQAVKAIFQHARDAVLEAFMWPFATFRNQLAVIASVDDDPTDVNLRTGWGFTYALPAKCIAPRYIYPGTNNPGEGQEIPFTIEGDETRGKVLLTDQDEAELVFTKLVDTPERWSPMFRDALAMRLAADLAMSVAKKPELGLNLHRVFKSMISEAAAAQANQARKELPPPDPSYIRDRG